MKRCLQLLTPVIFVFACKKDPEIVAPLGTAIFKFSVPPGSCPRPHFTGIYLKDIPLDSSNTAMIAINVTTAGKYGISTNTVNGVSFAGSGTFSAIGPDTIVLKGKGTPTVEGLYSLATKFDSLDCNLNFTVSTPATLHGFIICKIDGKNYSFDDSIVSPFSDSYDGDAIFIYGKTSFGSPEQISLGVSKPTGRVEVGTYEHSKGLGNEGSYSAGGIYADALNARWLTGDYPISHNDFNITITSVSANRAKGTFSGTLADNGGNGTNKRIVSDGSFDVPIK